MMLQKLIFPALVSGLLLAGVAGCTAGGTSGTVAGYTDVTAAEAHELITSNPDIIIIDVSPYYMEGHLPGAVSYPLANGGLAEAIPGLDKSKTYLVYCHSLAASTAAAKKLVDAGFKHVYRLQGNYAGWVAEGYPVER
jgi:rhodanese-related sulfurtransferase